ncbi:cyclohexanone monooxygenase [Phyllosticta citribraziliensis]|uniref:Cyclohexanone monooxygenase n=1 Tax=Phyllosticta citribraziliensis TaxID=989973 RepID=A0ABR1LU18_9PEZI
MAETKPWPGVNLANTDLRRATVVIIGAGMSDLIKRSQCRDFVILEKGSGCGGTWRDNKYPGCACDIWSHLYSFSFEQNPDWTRTYPGQEELQAYLENIARKWDLFRHMRLNTAVEEARWNDSDKQWKTTVRVAGETDGRFIETYTISSDFLVSAVGQLNTPQYPVIPGMDDFEGKSMHSARWDTSYDLRGKRVAVIGNGASAIQLIPEVAQTASSLTVFQRQANWILPRNDVVIPASRRALFRWCPPYRWRKRAVIMDGREESHEALYNSWSGSSLYVEQQFKVMLKRDLPHRPDLWDKLTPKYSPGCKRTVFSDDWFKSFAKPHVHLETRYINRMSSTGIEVEGGDHKEFDLVVYATGFRSVQFMYPIKVVGSGGRSLSDVWKEGPQAYYGITVESLPNFGMLYGPNTNLGHNSIVLMVEAQSRYIAGMIKTVIDGRRQGKTLAIQPKPEIVRAFNVELQNRLGKSAFADPNCSSWYKTKDGRVTNNWSGTVVEYQKKIEKVKWSDYIVEGPGADIVSGELKVGRVVEETQVSYNTIWWSAVSVLAGTVYMYATGKFKFLVSAC